MPRQDPHILGISRTVWVLADIWAGFHTYSAAQQDTAGPGSAWCAECSPCTERSVVKVLSFRAEINTDHHNGRSLWQWRVFSSWWIGCMGKTDSIFKGVPKWLSPIGALLPKFTSSKLTLNSARLRWPSIHLVEYFVLKPKYTLLGLILRKPALSMQITPVKPD